MRITDRTLYLLFAFFIGMLVCAARPVSAREHKKAEVLYVWAGDAARVAPDFLAVINFDERSKNYGKVIRPVPLPAPGDAGNEPHHMHLSAHKNVLACGGLLSL